MARVLVVGGYGVFGSRVAERLARDPDIEIVVAGRDAVRARAAAERLAQPTGGRTRAVSIDARRPDAARLHELAPAVVINASGPFQAQDHALAEACIAAGAHYVDLADASAFVLGLATHAGIDARARERGLLVATGASSVPALSCAVVDQLAPRLAHLDAVRHGISTGNSFDPGPATAASILGSLGKPFPVIRDGRAVIVHGWQGLVRHRFPRIGGRWMSYCEVPDALLFPRRFPGLRTVDFRAGVEGSLFHLGLWALSWPCRAGLIRRPERLAPALMALKHRLAFLGSDRGGMFVTLEGRDAAGNALRVDWHLIASSGHGPYIPATPAVILTRKLIRGLVRERGAMACLGLVTLSEFEAEIADLDIETTTS